MANFGPSCSKTFHVKGLVMGLFCLLAASCDLSQDFSRDFEEEKGSVVIVLPGAKARAVYLPESITGNMSYTIVFDSPGDSFSIDHTREKTIACELEPGFWDITVRAHYGDGAETAAQDTKPNVEILAGQTTSVTFTMNPEEFIIPDRVEGPNQDKYITTSDTPPILSVTMHTSTAFSGIDGWTDEFSYQWYFEDETGTPTNVGSPGSFSVSSPDSEDLSCTVMNSTVGAFSYWVKISNNYTYTPPGGGALTSGSVEKSIPVAEVTVNPPIVNPALADITINWPAGHLPEPVTGNMSYTLAFYKVGESVPAYSIGPLQGKAITRELEPGLWDITVTARYGKGAETIAQDTKFNVEVREEETTPVTFTMNAEEFLLPDRVKGPDQNTTVTTSDTPPSLSVTMHTSTAFSGIPGWADHFSYQWYWEDENGTPANVGSSGSFSAANPGSENLSCTVINNAVGIFSYGVKISNNYTYTPPGGGASTSGSVEKSIPVAEVTVNPPVVNPTRIAININWPAGHLPEPVTGNMSYTLALYKAGESVPAHSIGPTPERTIAQELEPGYWDITVTARYGNGAETTAQDTQPNVEILAGQTTPVTFTLNADKFILPDRVEGPSQDATVTTSDPPPSLSVTMKTSTAFSGIPGWADHFSYQWYFENEAGTPANVGSSGSFSASSPNLSCTVVNSAVGIFSYGVKITNNYTYTPPGGGTSTSGSVEKSIPVAEVTVNLPIPTVAAITINWPAGYLPESITDNMNYVVEFYTSGGSLFSIGPVPETTITRELEPGNWDIVVSAHYGNSTEWAAFDKKPQVEIRAEETNPLTFTMHADEFITPYLDGIPIDKTMVGSDPVETLSITMSTSTAFSGIPGWTDNFSYQMYREDGDETRMDIGSPGPFAAGSETLGWTVDPGALGVGTYYYYAEITNNYAHAPSSTTDAVTNSVYVGRVVVRPYAVGDTGPGGGTVFYHDPDGFMSNGILCHYLEAALTNVGPTVWGASGTSVGGTEAGIGTGYANTQTIVTRFDSLGESGGMARLVYGVTILGNTDWFLPSRDELVALYGCGLDDLVWGLGSPTWSSTELGDYAVWKVGYDTIPDSDFKNISNYFRPVRAFP